VPSLPVRVSPHWLIRRVSLHGKLTLVVRRDVACRDHLPLTGIRFIDSQFVHLLSDFVTKELAAYLAACILQAGGGLAGGGVPEMGVEGPKDGHKVQWELWGGT
jgi:hypothetical protein